MTESISFAIPEENTHKLARPIIGVFAECEYLDEPCLVCTSHKTKDGLYPRVSRNGRDWRISKYIFHTRKGEVPIGMVVRHKCDNTFCINPDHLEIGWPQDNCNDKVERNRQPKGEAIKASKLKTNDVYYIKFLAEESTIELAKKFNVSASTIRSIKTNKSWRWLTDEHYSRNVA